MSFQEGSAGRRNVVLCCPVCWSKWPEVTEIVSTEKGESKRREREREREKRER